MRVNLETKPGQAASGHKLTISEVLAEYLRAETSRLAHARRYSHPRSPKTERSTPGGAVATL